MGTQEFLKRVLPSTGQTVLGLVQINDDGRSWFKWKNYPSADEAARAALFFDSKGETVYFGVNSFGDWYDDEKTGKRRIRTPKGDPHVHIACIDMSAILERKGANPWG